MPKCAAKWVCVCIASAKCESQPAVVSSGLNARVVNMDFGLEFGRPEVTLRTRSVTGSVTLIPAALPLTASRDSGTDQVRCLCYWLYWIVICVLVCIPSATTLALSAGFFVPWWNLICLVLCGCTLSSFLKTPYFLRCHLRKLLLFLYIIQGSFFFKEKGRGVVSIMFVVWVIIFSKVNFLGFIMKPSFKT